jgi:hypothetical protein
MLQHSWRATKDPRFQQAFEILLADLADEGDVAAEGGAEAMSTSNDNEDL